LTTEGGVGLIEVIDNVRKDLSKLGVNVVEITVDDKTNYASIDIGEDIIPGLATTFKGNSHEVFSGFYMAFSGAIRKIIEEHLAKIGLVCEWFGAHNMHVLRVKKGEEIVEVFKGRIADIFAAVRDSFQPQLSFT